MGGHGPVIPAGAQKGAAGNVGAEASGQAAGDGNIHPAVAVFDKAPLGAGCQTRRAGGGSGTGGAAYDRQVPDLRVLHIAEKGGVAAVGPGGHVPDRMTLPVEDAPEGPLSGGADAGPGADAHGAVRVFQGDVRSQGDGLPGEISDAGVHQLRQARQLFRRRQDIAAAAVIPAHVRQAEPALFPRQTPGREGHVSFAGDGVDPAFHLLRVFRGEGEAVGKLQVHVLRPDVVIAPGSDKEGVFLQQLIPLAHGLLLHPDQFPVQIAVAGAAKGKRLLRAFHDMEAAAADLCEDRAKNAVLRHRPEIPGDGLPVHREGFQGPAGDRLGADHRQGPCRDAAGGLAFYASALGLSDGDAAKAAGGSRLIPENGIATVDARGICRKGSAVAVELLEELRAFQLCFRQGLHIQGQL